MRKKQYGVETMFYKANSLSDIKKRYINASGTVLKKVSKQHFDNGDTILTLAIRLKNHDFIGWLMRRRLDVDWHKETWQGEHPLIVALEVQDMYTNILLASVYKAELFYISVLYFDPEYYTDYRIEITLFEYALKHTNIYIVYNWIRYGIDINKINICYTTLQHVINHRMSEACALLLQKTTYTADTLWHGFYIAYEQCYMEYEYPLIVAGVYRYYEYFGKELKEMYKEIIPNVNKFLDSKITHCITVGSERLYTITGLECEYMERTELYFSSSLQFLQCRQFVHDVISYNKIGEDIVPWQEMFRMLNIVYCSYAPQIFLICKTGLCFPQLPIDLNCIIWSYVTDIFPINSKINFDVSLLRKIIIEYVKPDELSSMIVTY